MFGQHVSYQRHEIGGDELKAIGGVGWQGTCLLTYVRGRKYENRTKPDASPKK
jgi:hypothetical protein